MEKRGIALELEGLRLVGEVYIPEHGPSPALCLCHGVPRGGVPDPGDRGYPFLAERFCRAGFVTLIFNFRGTGDSGGNFDILGWTRDLEAALDFLCDTREVDRSRICLMGFSGGAAVSVYVAAKDHRVSSLVVCACPTEFRFAADAERAKSAIEHFRDIGIIREKDFPASVADWMDGFNEAKPMEQIENISPRPLLIVHGAQDDVVDPSSAWALYERAREPKEIVIIEGAGHRLRVAEKAMDSALDWLRAHV
jgi:fermentation-respiration switch protein FrsA (DUF1100 family)